MDHETEVAKLRIEIRTKTRLVLRVVELTTRTTLPTTARIIRAARGWYADRAFKFAAGDTVWASTRNRRSGNERPARNRRFQEVVEKGRTVEFTHDIGRKRKLTVLIEEVHLSTEPETAYPRMTDAVGTLAVEDLRSTRTSGAESSPQAWGRPWSTNCPGRQSRTPVKKLGGGDRTRSTARG